MSDAPSAARPQRAPEPAFFDDPTIDHLIAVTLELGAELWVQRERVRALERILGEKGLVSPDALERYQPTPEEAERGRAERDAFVNRIYGAFARQTVPGTPERQPSD
jgi:hypothetical protein